MNDTLFFQSFTFQEFHYQNDQHNDLREGLPMHYLGYLKTGRGLLLSGKQRTELAPGDLFYIPKHFPYQSHWYGREDTCFDSFGFQYLPSSNKKYALQKVTYDKETKELLLKLSENKTVNYTSIGRLYSLFGMVEPHMHLRSSHPQHELVNFVTEYMNKYPNATMSQVANACDISETSLYRLCHKHLHTTPNELRHHILCNKSIELLTTTDLPIEEISSLLGFSSSSYFRKILFAETKKTPREIRKNATIL